MYKASQTVFAIPAPSAEVAAELGINRNDWIRTGCQCCGQESDLLTIPGTDEQACASRVQEWIFQPVSR